MLCISGPTWSCFSPTSCFYSSNPTLKPLVTRWRAADGNVSDWWPACRDCVGLQLFRGWITWRMEWCSVVFIDANNANDCCLRVGRCPGEWYLSEYIHLRHGTQHLTSWIWVLIRLPFVRVKETLNNVLHKRLLNSCVKYVSVNISPACCRRYSANSLADTTARLAPLWTCMRRNGKTPGLSSKPTYSTCHTASTGARCRVSCPT